MIKKLLDKIKKRTLLISINSRLRIVFRLANKSIYRDYTNQKIYSKLYKKYKSTIDSGIDESLVKKQNNIIWICWLHYSAVHNQV